MSLNRWSQLVSLLLRKVWLQKHWIILIEFCVLPPRKWLKNPQICRTRKVLELGGGMSCLAGVLAAKYCEPSSVMLTDGNRTSMENVKCIVGKNDSSVMVRCAVVQWSRVAKAQQQSASSIKNQHLQVMQSTTAT